MKIGIWCDYGVTLQPSEGIGVFVANLVRGLAQLPEVEECLLISKRHEEHLLSELNDLGHGKVRIAGNPRAPWAIRKSLKKLRRTSRAHQFNGRPSTPVSRGLAYVQNWMERHTNRPQRRLIDSVDVWLLPYVGLDQFFSRPTVVVVHDLVTYHFPQLTNPKRLGRFKQLVRDVTDQATLVACMSNFILENDLLKTLQLPPEKTRMVRVAIPEDIGQDASYAPIPESLAHARYLLYPAAFREYKNHSYLVDALTCLHERNAHQWHVVFTGITDCPEALRQKIAESPASDRIHVLGRVSRAELATLYRHAFATVVPSLYEQGSFPLMEALHFGCPILSSDIPSLREQLQQLGDAALFFDPHRPESLLDQLQMLEANLEWVLDGQREGFRSMGARTWRDAAQDWLQVLAEAKSLAEPCDPSKRTK